jgi:cation diffusion facilitator CzcD-associated flavoprotein CzcO
MSTLPGHAYASGTPLFPTRDHFVAYLRDYAHRAELVVETDRSVDSLQREGERWVATVDEEQVPASAVVMATGIMSNPVAPELPGRDEFRGEVIHSVAYRRPGGYLGKRVLVVGVGNSGGEIASELGVNGADVTVLVRRGANVVPRSIAGVPIQYLAAGMNRLPRPARLKLRALVQRLSALRHGPPAFPPLPASELESVPLIGFHLVEAIRAGRVNVKLGTIARLEATRAVFSDGSRGEFDAIILATGFAPALGPLGSLIRRDERGFALRTDNVKSADHPDLWFVGMRYDTTGAIANIKADSMDVARRLAVGTVLGAPGRLAVPST